MRNIIKLFLITLFLFFGFSGINANLGNSSDSVSIGYNIEDISNRLYDFNFLSYDEGYVYFSDSKYPDVIHKSVISDEFIQIHGDISSLPGENSVLFSNYHFLYLYDFINSGVYMERHQYDTTFETLQTDTLGIQNARSLSISSTLRVPSITEEISPSQIISALGEDYIYYTPFSKQGLYRMNFDGTDKQLMYSGYVSGLQYANEGIYFIGLQNPDIYEYSIFYLKLDNFEVNVLQDIDPEASVVINSIDNTDIYYTEYIRPIRNPSDPTSFIPIVHTFKKNLTTGETIQLGDVFTNTYYQNKNYIYYTTSIAGKTQIRAYEKLTGINHIIVGGIHGFRLDIDDEYISVSYTSAFHGVDSRISIFDAKTFGEITTTYIPNLHLTAHVDEDYIYYLESNTYNLYRIAHDETGNTLIPRQDGAFYFLHVSQSKNLYMIGSSDHDLYELNFETLNIQKITDGNALRYFSFHKGDYIYFLGYYGPVYRVYIEGLSSTPPAPTNLTQSIQSPNPGGDTLDPTEIPIGTSVGKFQSGSGVILSAEIPADTRLVVEIFESENSISQYIGYGAYNVSSEPVTGKIIIPYSYIESGDYYWVAKVEDANGNMSDGVEFGNNTGNDTDFSFFEGFEPYPHGYRFNNNSPIDGLLTGGVSGREVFISYPFVLNEPTINPGYKWDIFNSAFDTSSFDNDTRKLADAFESVGLNEDDALQGGNCYGMAVSAAMHYKHDILIPQTGTQNLWESILQPNLVNEEGVLRWSEFNDTTKAIFTSQVEQDSTIETLAKINGVDNANNIAKKLKDHLHEKTYVLNFWGVSREPDDTDSSVGHAVIPYKVEDTIDGGYKIYFWDNNYPYPGENITFAYNQYIKVFSDGKWEAPLYKYKNEILQGWIEFTEMSLVDVDEIYNSGNTSIPRGFNGTDISYTLSGNSNLYVSDSLGRVSGFQDGLAVREIPGVDVVVPLNATLSGSVENTWKQIYLPQKQGLTVYVEADSTESYDLMIAGGDYYTKLEGVETSSGQVDSFVPTIDTLQIDFDDTKTGEYTLLIDNFQETNTGTVYIEEAEVMPESQQYSIDWQQAQNNSEESVTYEIDTDGDGNYDMAETFPALTPPEPVLDYQITLQNPKHIDFDETTQAYTCDPNRKKCKINFGIRKLSGKNLGNKNHICSTDFGFGETDQDTTCNPRKVVFPSGEHTVTFSVAKKDNPDEIITKQVTVINSIKNTDFSIELNNNKYISQSPNNPDEYICNPNKKKCYFNIQFTQPDGENLSNALSCEIVYPWGETQTKCNPKRIKVPQGQHQISLRVYETQDSLNFSEKVITLKRD